MSLGACSSFDTFPLMTQLQTVCKDLAENAEERNDIADLWRKQYRAALIVALKTSEARLLRIEADLHARIAGGAPGDGPLDEGWAETIQAAERITKSLDVIHGRMLDMGLHPTRPKALQPSKGNRRNDPVQEATLVTPPNPEGLPPESASPPV